MQPTPTPLRSANPCLQIRNALRQLLLAIALLAATATSAIEPAALVRNFPRTQLLLVTAERCIAIEAWVAANNAQRAQGLMHVTAMGRHEGMLFVYDRPQIISMWMKNTYIPLDMLFATADGQIVHLHRNAIPHDTSVISSGEAVSLVIELNAGSVEAFGIAPGTRVVVPAG